MSVFWNRTRKTFYLATDLQYIWHELIYLKETITLIKDLNITGEESLHLCIHSMGDHRSVDFNCQSALGMV